MSKLLQFFRSSVRGRLACLVLAITLPALVLVTLLVFQAYRNERESVAQHMLSTTRAVAALVDHQIGESESLLVGLASARELERGDIAGFEARVRSLQLGPDRWLVLADADGQQLVNTRVAPGTPLPRLEVDGEFRRSIERGQTYVSNLITGPALQRPVLFVAVPVGRTGQPRYTLSYVMAPTAFSTAMSMERISPGLVVSIVDRTGTVAARHPGGDRFVGERATPDVLRAIRNASDGVMETITLDGERVLAALSRAPSAGWTVAMGAPYTALYASARRLLVSGAVVSAILMLIASAMAVWIGRAVVRSIDLLMANTNALGRGLLPAATSSGLAETDYVAAAMRQTAQRLGERERDNAGLTAALQTELAKQKAAEEASRRLAAIVESSDDAIIGKDLSGKITSWNKAAERIFGYTAEEMLGRSVTVLIPEHLQSEEPRILERIRRGERTEHFDTLRRRKDGTLVPISLSISPVLDLEGRIIGASKIARDVSQRHRSEAQQQALYELVASVNRAEALPEIYEAALGAMVRCQNADRAAILLRDGSGAMRFEASHGLSDEYRRAVEGHSPWQPGDTQPKPLWIDDVAHATLENALRRAVEAEGIRSLAFIPLTSHKRLLGKFMLYYNVPHTFTAAELRPVETIARQVAFAIERQKSAEALEALVDERTASLRQAVAQMEEFSYSVSHDLRAPARAMCGYAEAILQDHGAQLDDLARDMLTRIQRNGQRMDRLIQDLLTYTRISRREVRLEPVSLEKLIREVVQQYPDLRPERADIEVEGPLPDVMAHEPSLTQVISNLLTNAVKFVPPQSRPRVRVRVDRGPTRARLSFQDNGIGIKPESQPRLFRMFERVHPDKHYEGTGIGLAIVRKAVERMNGIVGVESDGVSGSNFWFELPIARSGGHAADETSPPGGVPTSERPHVQVHERAHAGAAGEPEGAASR